MSTSSADVAPVATATPRDRSLPRGAGVILAVLCSAQLVLSVDVTVVTVASASIERALGFNSGNLQWTITAYALTFGGFLLLGGRLADLYGRRRLFIASVAGFALASVCAGASQNTTELIAARAAQGLFAAVISPAVLAILAATFAEGRARQRAFGVWATAGSLGGLTGFLFGGFITSFLGWRWIFFINVPIATVAITGAVVLLTKDQGGLERRRLDVPGAVSVTFALALVIYGLGEAQSTSWTATTTLASLTASPILLGAFFLIERRTKEPLLPFALLRRRAAFGNVISVLQVGAGASTAFLVPLYLQQVWGYSAAHAGLSTLPLPLGFGVGARFSSKLLARLGARRIVTIGFGMVALGLAWLVVVPTHGDYFTSFLPALFIRSMGQGLVVVPIAVFVTSGVDKADVGIASGLYNMSQQLGGALGLAAIATVAAAAAVGISPHIAGEAHGIRVGFLVCMVVAIVGGAISVSSLRHSDGLAATESTEIHPMVET